MFPPKNTELGIIKRTEEIILPPENINAQKNTLTATKPMDQPNSTE